MARSSKISLLKSLIKLIFSGQLYIKDGHLAKQAHDIPDGFLASALQLLMNLVITTI